MKKYLSIFILGLFFTPYFVNGATVIIEDFESYVAPIEVVGLSNPYVTWTGSIGNGTVTTGSKKNGFNGLHDDGASYRMDLTTPYTASTTSRIIVSYWVDELDGAVNTVEFYNSALVRNCRVIGEASGSNVRLINNSGAGDVIIGVDPGGYYKVYIDINFEDQTCRGKVDNGLWSSTVSQTLTDISRINFTSGGDAYYDDFTVFDVPNFSDTSSRIVSFNPSSGERVNTSMDLNGEALVDFEVEWFFNSSIDYGTADEVQVQFLKLEDNQFLGGPYQYTPISFPIIASGYTTETGFISLRAGYHGVAVMFRDSSTGQLFAGETYYFINGFSYDTTLIGAGDINEHPILQALLTGSSTLPGISQVFASSTPSGYEDCTQYEWWSNPFQRLGCSLSETILGGIKDIFIPKQENWLAIQNQLKTGMLSKFPIGYITEVVDILGTEATTTFPIASFTIKDGEYLSGEYSVDLGQIMAEANTLVTEDFTTENSIIESDETQNVWDMIMPTLEVIGYSLLIITILLELFGLGSSMGYGYKQSTHITGISKDNEISYETPGFSRYKQRR